MCVITGQKMNLYWIIGFLVLWTGVITTDNFEAAPEVITTNSTEISAFIISIKITNRIYNDSLEDHQSQSYKLLRQDVENMFLEIYSSAPSLYYQDITEMIFSNGSVIANSTVIFGSKQRSGQTVKDIFVTKYKQDSTHPLDLNINYTEDQELIHVPDFLLPNILQHDSTSSSTASIAGSHIFTASELSHNRVEKNSSLITPTLALTDSSDKSFASTMPALGLTSMTTYSNRILLTSDSSSVNMTTNPSSITSNVSGSGTIKTTTNPSRITSNVSGSGTIRTTTNPSSIALNVSGSGTIRATTNPSSITSNVTESGNIRTTTNPSSIALNVSGSGTIKMTTNPSSITSNVSGTGTVHTTTNPSIKTSTMAFSSQKKNTTQWPTRPEGSVTVAADQGVPGWGIAILVLAAVILFFMLVLLIMLLLFWCCWWKQRGFMNVSDADPTGYYNTDIPMYSTHSTYDSHNGKSLVAISERPSKKWTGMYKVNK